MRANKKLNIEVFINLSPGYEIQEHDFVSEAALKQEIKEYLEEHLIKRSRFIKDLVNRELNDSSLEQKLKYILHQKITSWITPQAADVNIVKMIDTRLLDALNSMSDEHFKGLIYKRLDAIEKQIMKLETKMKDKE